MFIIFFIFNDTSTTQIYTLSLHDALPISQPAGMFAELRDSGVRHRDSCRAGPTDPCGGWAVAISGRIRLHRTKVLQDRKSTRLNSSHPSISYAVFCLKKKKNATITICRAI